MDKNPLVRGASQYLATLKEAQEHLEDNQILLVGNYNEFPQVASIANEKQVVLLEYSTTADELRNEALAGTQTTEVYLNDAITIVPRAFCAATPLTRIKLPAKLKEIEDAAFSECAELTEIQIPQTVETIGITAFAACLSLDVVIPDTVKTIGDNAFAQVPHITYHGTAEGAPWGANSMN